jgi:hypothetical protein
MDAETFGKSRPLSVSVVDERDVKELGQSLTANAESTLLVVDWAQKGVFS